MLKLLFTYLTLLSGLILTAQTGGRSSYDFLNLSENARFSALGGQNVSLLDSLDPNTFTLNPALLSDSATGKLSFSNLPFYADIRKIGASYIFYHPKTGSIGINFQNVHYGTLTETDIDGTVLGEFTPNEYAITVSKAHTIEPFSLGVSIKLAGSSIGSYSSAALMADFGGVFKHPTKNLTVGLAFKNLGFALKNYTSEKTRLPTDIQLGTSYKLEHLPLRLSITAHSLLTPDIQYLNPNFHTSFNSEGDEIADEKNIAAQIFRHVTFGGEFLFGKNFHFRLGYNHQQRAEMILQKIRSGAGFSWGAMLRIKSFEINYTRSTYHITGGVNILTITMDIERIIDHKKGKRAAKNT